MAITNAMIISNAQQELLKAGKIKPTGRTLTAIINGEEMSIPEPEPIHTFNFWKEHGYIVRKGEHAIANFSIWKYTTKAKGKTEEEAQEEGFCFLKRSFFFAAHQVEPLRGE